jgi:hypothetical protein
VFVVWFFINSERSTLTDIRKTVIQLSCSMGCQRDKQETIELNHCMFQSYGIEFLVNGYVFIVFSKDLFSCNLRAYQKGM